MPADLATPLVIITHLAPVAVSDNAGQSYVSAQARHWAERRPVHCLMISGHSAREDLPRSLVPATVINQTTGARRRIAAVIDRLLRWSYGSGRRTLALDLATDPDARATIAGAGVVVLQWHAAGMLAGTVRRINPRATIVVVLHDVVSQSLERHHRFGGDLRSRLKFALAHRIALRNERRLIAVADRLVVLSDKDADLLPTAARAKVRIVPASVAAPDRVVRHPVPGRIVMVANWRWENAHGLDWFRAEVLPRLRASGVDHEVHLIGPSLDPDHTRRAEADGLMVRGFVADLTAEYAAAAVAAVPLWLGAGVKFKTVEAILHRVPLVTTSVGAEGIDSLTGDPGLTDDPDRFADLLVGALTDPEAAQRHADALLTRTADAHSAAAFARAMDAVLG